MLEMQLLESRFRRAFSELDGVRQEQVMEFMRQSYEAMCQRVEVALGRAPDLPPQDDFGAEGVAYAYAIFFEDPRHLRIQVELLERHRLLGDALTVTEEGEIVGTGKYEILDPRWVESVVVWLEFIFNRVDFLTGKNVIQIPDETTIAVIGDWGTGPIPGQGPTPSLAMMQFIGQQLKPAYTIHLGDTYYAGTPAEESDNFLPAWVPGTLGTFTLNSNHEMMAGGHGYFGTLLTHPDFAAQKGLSHFALENSSWIVVGLDSAYFADRWKMYSPGALDEEHQLPFLQCMAEKARSENKKVIVLTHHNGFRYDGPGSTEALWKQVLSAFSDGAGPAYWYWGHVHIGAVYPARDGVEPRCSGHAGIPWGLASGLEKAQQEGRVVWFESDPIVDRPPQVSNGFTFLELSVETIRESYFTQDGKEPWSS